MLTSSRRNQNGTSSSIIPMDFKRIGDISQSMGLRTQIHLLFNHHWRKMPLNRISLASYMKCKEVTKFHEHNTGQTFWIKILKAIQVNDLSANDVYFARIKPLPLYVSSTLFFRLQFKYNFVFIWSDSIPTLFFFHSSTKISI